MSYKIIDVQGIGDVYAAKLAEVGINTVEELLEVAKKPAGRAELAEKTGISPKLVLTWANHADLMRINGVGPQFSELLEAAGVDTVKEFRHRVADNLAAKMVEINEEKHLVGRVPTAAEIQKMIDQAKEMEPMMEY
jgi:predicted flap endonuclease-1-like 5' DNA nuclease